MSVTLSLSVRVRATLSLSVRVSESERVFDYLTLSRRAREEAEEETKAARSKVQKLLHGRVSLVIVEHLCSKFRCGKSGWRAMREGIGAESQGGG